MMGKLKIYPGKLSGEVKIPPSKSMAHRAVICAALGDGVSKDAAHPAHCFAAVMSVASALTNLLVAILVFTWRRRNEYLIQLVGWACIISLGLNVQWFLNHRSGLRIGYYLWWLSFGVLGLACLLPPSKTAPAEH
jgi:hypothetical protein